MISIIVMDTIKISISSNNRKIYNIMTKKDRKLIKIIIKIIIMIIMANIIIMISSIINIETDF